GGLLALKDAAGIDAHETESVLKVASVAHQAASRDKLADHENRRHCVAKRQGGELFTLVNKERIGADHERTGSQLDQGCKGGIKVALSSCVQDMELQADGACSLLQKSRLGLGIGIGRVDE